VKPPRRAIVLAAGFGSRLAPLTHDCPKPLIPIRGVPLIQRVLRQLAAWGVQEVAVNLHHRADRIMDALPGLCPTGMRLTLSYEPGILGTGGALKRLEFFIGNEPFWLCNADVVQELDPVPLLRDFARHRPLASLWMIPDRGPRTVTVQEGRITDFRGGGMTFSGLHLISPRVRSYLPPEETFSSVIDFYDRALSEGLEVRGVTVPDSQWEDAGTPQRVLELEGRALILPGAEVSSQARLDGKTLVGPGARIRARRNASGLIVSPRHYAPYPRPFQNVEAVEVLEARGSDRAFLRVHLPQKTLICARSGDQRPENDRTAGHFRFLERKGVRVPHVEWVSRDRREVWMEDVGREDLRKRLMTGSVKRNRSDMRRVMELISDFHAVRVPKRLELEPAFGPDLYQWEHHLFAEEFLARHDPETDPAPLLNELADMANGLQNQPDVLLHRDLQSTNVLWYQRKPVLIDVQGMRLGPRVYDLGSLLADPYVGRSPEEQVEALEMYNRLSGTSITVEEYRIGAVQRLVQALGAYGRLGARPETKRFLQHIPSAMEQIRKWAPSSELQSWANRFFMRQSR